jgi:hypothetical protein
MKRNRQELDNILDEAINGINSAAPDQKMVAGAAERVWAQLSSETATAAPAEIVAVEEIHGCKDFQTLIPALLSGKLSSARSLLLEDHTRECIPCRKALKAARSGSVVTASPSRTAFAKQASPMPSVWKWAIAATLVIGFALGAMLFMNRYGFGTDSRATLQAANGTIYKVTDTESRVLNVGESVKRGERIRTSKDASAVVKLSDGSLVEMNERSELSVSENSQGTIINLARGNVIVQAAKQRSRHLYVSTSDALVSVTGTIFSVNSGTKGSRVSVVEGEVRVNHAGNEQVLHPGDQTTSTQNLERVPVHQEISWSRDALRYAKLVAELTSLRKELNQKAPKPGVRYSTRFLDMVPEGTVLYAALPNLTATLSESHKIMQERISQNPALSEWWKEHQGTDKGKSGLDDVMSRVREFGEQLGNELVVSAEMDAQGQPTGPLVLAELKNAAEFRSFLEKQLAQLNAEAKNAPAIRIIDSPSSVNNAPPTDAKAQVKEVFLWINDNYLAASTNVQQLKQLESIVKAPGTNRFASSPFYARIAEIYKEGAGLIVAADLEKIINRAVEEDGKKEGGQKRTDIYRQLGLLNLKHFVIEQKELEAKTQSRAILSFSESRRGIASWLAAPGPMGALEFVSQDANVVTAFVVREPVALVDDLLGVLETASPGLRQHLRNLETQQGLDVRRDFAAPLGGEFAFTIDGPILPTPSWKIVFEVYDQVRLQQTFERVVEEANKWAAKEGKPGLQWEKTEVGGRTFYALKSTTLGLEVHYTYANGYMVAAPTRALVDRALSYRESGYTLLNSRRFRSTLPEDGNTNFSAIFYHDLAPLLKPLAERVANNSNGEQQSITQMAADAPPTLAYVYAQNERIVLAANTEGGPFGLSPGSLLGLPNAFGIQHILMKAMHDKKPQEQK